MRFILTLILSLPFFLIAETIYVPNDHPTIQEAINFSSDGDVIEISEGIYYESMITSQGKNIVITGETGVNQDLLVTIDGQGTNIIFMFNGADGPGCIIENLIIKNSSGNAIWMYASNPVIRNCILSDNLNSEGAAIWGSDSDPWIDNCTLKSNSTDIIMQNYSSIFISDCLFENTHVSDSSNSIILTQSSTAFINDSEFDGHNMNGGKIIFYGYNDGSYAEINNCLFHNYISPVLDITKTNIEIENSEFKDNDTDGPLIIISEEEPVLVIIINTDFCGNESSDPNVLIEGPWWDYVGNSFSDECECEDGDIIDDSPCNPMECWDGQWYEIIIDCAEDFGMPCEGGLYIPPPEGVCCAECISFGDINYDSEVNILDVIQTVSLVLNEEYNEIIDMNYDGIINILDIIEIINIILD